MARKFYKENNESIPAIVFENNAPEGFTEITDENELHELYLDKYAERQNDGMQYCNEFRATLYMEMLKGTNTESETFLLENHLANLKDELISGNWLTAQNTLENLPLLGIYDATMQNEIKSHVDQYVIDNY